MANKPYLQAGTLSHPLLRELNELSLRCSGVSFLIVYPANGHWGQAIPGKIEQPEFCSLIKTNKQGGKQCRMSHIMMSIAACRSGIYEHRCHAGSLILVHPLSNEKDGTVALVSTCLSSLGGKRANWGEARKVGQALGLNLSQLKKAHAALPALEDNGELAREFMKMAADLIREIKLKASLESRLEAALAPRSKSRNMTQLLVERLTVPKSVAESPRPSFALNKMGKLIQVTADLIREQPCMPYNIEDLSSSLRVSPNHFSSEFRRHTGQRFSEFLSGQRIEYSKKLLGDITLNIEEVALESGYSDSSYYARKFKQRTGKTPTQWRESLISA